MAEVGHDILEHILLRLDLRDLIRCKCVCKSWQFFISTPRFVNAHLISSYNHDRNNKNFTHRRIVMTCSPFGQNPFQQGLNDWFFNTCGKSQLLGSCNGLVCISMFFSDELLVANPSTREVKKLRKPNLPDMFIRSLCWGFGYDSSANDYKIVVGFMKSNNQTCFKVLRLKSNVWKDVGEVRYNLITSIGILCNGSLHWLMDDHQKEDVILSFDLHEEEFKEIPHPDDEVYKYMIGVDMSLGVVDECLCLFVRRWSTDVIWIMKKYNIKESWQFNRHDWKLKHVAVHCLTELRNNIPYERSLCHNIWSYMDSRFIGAPEFVQSLVSPVVGRRLKRKWFVKKRKRKHELIKRDSWV